MDKQKITTRLKRINGQITGIISMIEAERECEETLTQIKAARSGLAAVATELIKLEAEHCLDCDPDPKVQSKRITELADNIFKIS